MKTIDRPSIIRDRLAAGKSSPLKTYMDLTVGQQGSSYFLLYETLTAILGPMPGGAGYFLRKAFYPRILGAVGKGLIIGRNVVIRHPHNLFLGDNVTVDDNCVLDGRGAGDLGIVLEDQVLINRNCMLLAKTGPIRLGRRTSLGSNSVVVSMDGVEVGQAVLTAGGCYLSAGAYQFSDANAAVMDQEAFTTGPIRIGDNAWLGTRVTILDGVSVGKGAVIGAGALVTKDIPADTIAFGVPAKVVKARD